MSENNKLSITTQLNWHQVKKALWEVEQRRETGELPVICYYRKSGILIGSFMCNDEEGDTVLFFNSNYPHPETIVNLIVQHCQILNEEVAVYPLASKGINFYETLTPQSYINVDL